MDQGMNPQSDSRARDHTVRGARPGGPSGAPQNTAGRAEPIPDADDPHASDARRSATGGGIQSASIPRSRRITWAQL